MKSVKVLKLFVCVLMLGLFMGTAPALAAQGGELVRFVGTVTAIDLQGENFIVSDRNKKTTKFFVNPATEFEIEKGKNFFSDDDIPFKDLKVGDWVKIKSHRINGELEASDVEIYR